MRTHHSLYALVTALTLASAASLPAQPTEATAIRAMLDKQAADWNHGDLHAFATGYKNAPDILFMGKTISRGYAQMLDSYKKNYNTRDKMGILSFSNLEVQPLDSHFATVTGNFHLERSASVGNSDGYYLLVVEKTPDGWKIIRDDTTNVPKTAK